MSELRFALLGAGFWARYQLAGWRELAGARCVAIYNRTRAKAEALAAEFDVPAVYDDAELLLATKRLDFVDIVTDPGTHAEFTALAARRGLPVICQKPLAPGLAEAERMAAGCAEAGVPLLVNENWRWQTPIRQLRAALDSGVIGAPLRARIQYSCSFPVFDNQPFLKELDQFILTDIGTHILDVARFLFGEASQLLCLTRRSRPDIRGEDLATVMMAMRDGISVVCEMSYASRLEHERFPETYVLVEGERGSIELGPDYWLRVTTAEGTHARRHPPPRYSWADPAYDLIHASIVPCQANLLSHLSGAGQAETTADDNLRTLRLVFGAYESAASGRSVTLGQGR
jgi:predicted dehydrogenase